jgi:tetratricopeptide (TPR) repeat protein
MMTMTFMLKYKTIFSRILFVFVFLALPALVTAQKKEKKKKNKNKCEAVSEQDLINYATLSPPISVIDHATGWAKQNNGAWYSMRNEIPFPDQKANKDNSGARKLGLDNFTELEMRSLIIGNKQYSVLIKKYRDGEYEFPVLKENWKPYRSLDFYVFPTDRLFKLLPDSITFNESYAVAMHVLTRGTIKDYKHKNWQSILVGQAEQTHLGEKINGNDLIIAVYPIKNQGKEVCRFRLIKSFDNSYLESIYTAPNHWAYLFNRKFYEVKYFTFKNFVQAAKDQYVKVVPENKYSNSNTFENNYHWGILKYRVGDYIKAIEYFEKAIAQNPNTQDFMLYAYLGNAQSKLHRYNDAINSYDQALSIQPTSVMEYANWVRNYFNRGVAKYYLGDMQGACKDWNKALELGFGPAHDYIMEYCNKKEK